MRTLSLLLLSCAATCLTMSAQSLSGEALVDALRSGGHVIVMRHATSPTTPPTSETANPDNQKHERQLDELGRNQAITMGRALKNLRIPIGSVQSSPTYRALETVKYLDLGTPEIVPELGDNGQSMSGGTAAQAEWLKKRVLAAPLVNNDFIITHQPVIAAAFPQITNISDGDALIFGRNGQLISRVSIVTWPQLVRIGAR
jgi:phosphohistidine phosphatase SixA